MHMMHMICMVRLEGSIQTDLVPRRKPAGYDIGQLFQAPLWQKGDQTECGTQAATASLHRFGFQTCHLLLVQLWAGLDFCPCERESQ